MLRLPLGIILLLAVSVMIYFGVAQRILDKLRLSDKAALGVIAAVIIGGFINLPLPHGPRLEASINVGGALIPLLLASYLLVAAGTWKERLRAIVGMAATAVAVYLSGLLLGAEPETMLLDPIYIYPLVAGSVAYITGRSRRSAFIAGTAGVLLVDLFTYLRLLVTGIPGAVLIGGGGAFDVVITSGLLAVMLAEFVGETRERLQGGPRETGRPPALLKRLRRPDSQSEDHNGEGERNEQGKED